MLNYHPDREARAVAVAIPAAAPRSSVAALTLDRRWLQWLPFCAVVLLALGLNAWGAMRSGYGNTYYAAAVRSMSSSWKNFFFGAFDQGGFITVDKPPAFLWVDALSARIFGYSTWSLMLPSAVAGAASVALLWLIVRRCFGVNAATISAAVLALTPISVAVNRLNLPEPFMILALVGAAWATLQSLESRRWWAWVALAGALVGVAFNIKMLAAWIPGPALALALVVATRSFSWASMRQLFLRLAVLGVTTVAISASWMLVVDAWPASARPYIGGSTDNTVLDLTLGYNGLGRVDGEDQLGAGGARGGTPPAGFRRPDGTSSTQPSGTGLAPQDGQAHVDGGAAQAGPAGAGFTGAGGIVAGTPGLWRMFDAANGGQIAWLLPFALGSGLIALWSWRRDPARRAVAALFLGWVGLYGGVFSYAQGIFHSYYTAAMAPGIAALAGIGPIALVDLVKRDRRWLIAAVVLIAVTVLVQLQLAGREPDFYGWVPPLMVAGAIAGAAAMIAAAIDRRRLAAAGMGLALGALLLIPAAWSVSVSANASLNSTLPQAGQQQGASGRTFGSASFDTGTAQLAAWLRSNNDPDATWQLVVSSAQNASTLIAEYDIAVMALGGFSGRDNTITVSGFADLVDAGAVRYVLVSSGGPGGTPAGADGTPAAGSAVQATNGAVPGGALAGASNTVMSAVRAGCTAVTGDSLPSQYQGQLYDCAGDGAALRALAQ